METYRDFVSTGKMQQSVQKTLLFWTTVFYHRAAVRIRVSRCQHNVYTIAITNDSYRGQVKVIYSRYHNKQFHSTLLYFFSEQSLNENAYGGTESI